MSTPEGWSAATMLFHMLRSPPIKGSYQELILQLYVLRQEYHRSEEIKILAEASLLGQDGFKVLEGLWKDHIQARFPWFANHAKAEREEAAELLNEEVQRGPIQITPLLPVSKDAVTLGTIPAKNRSRRSSVPYELRSTLSQVPKLGATTARKVRR